MGRRMGYRADAGNGAVPGASGRDYSGRARDPMWGSGFSQPCRRCTLDRMWGRASALQIGGASRPEGLPHMTTQVDCRSMPCSCDCLPASRDGYRTQPAAVARGSTGPAGRSGWSRTAVRRPTRPSTRSRRTGWQWSRARISWSRTSRSRRTACSFASTTSRSIARRTSRMCSRPASPRTRAGRIPHVDGSSPISRSPRSSSSMQGPGSIRVLPPRASRRSRKPSTWSRGRRASTLN